MARPRTIVTTTLDARLLRDEPTRVRPLLCCLLSLLLGASAFGAKNPGGWELWDGCTLLADRFFDGDSFQIKRGRTVHVLRLYFVDAPETDTGYGGRIAEQASYFGIPPDEVLRGGASAREFVAQFLAQPFRVITRRQSAPGASRAARFYAIIERDGGRLDAALIQGGLARATSEAADFPDEAAGRQRVEHLRALEQKAAQEGQGMWAKSQRTDRQATLVERLTPSFLKRGDALPAARKVKLNSASQFDLEALPGIGPKTAAAIIRARPLGSFERLDAVPGLGAKKIEALRPLVSFD